MQLLDAAFLFGALSMALLLSFAAWHLIESLEDDEPWQ